MTSDEVLERRTAGNGNGQSRREELLAVATKLFARRG